MLREANMTDGNSTLCFVCESQAFYGVRVPAACFMIKKFAQRDAQEKCAAAERDPAINPSPRARRAVSSLLFL
jgi:hypothetical protein